MHPLIVPVIMECGTGMRQEGNQNVIDRDRGGLALGVNLNGFGSVTAG